MKNPINIRLAIPILAASVLLTGTPLSHAQLAAVNTAAASAVAPIDTPYDLTERGEYFNVWHKTVTRRNQTTGLVETEEHSYTELASGLNYRDQNGQLQPTREEFLPTPDGFIAQSGRQMLHLASNLNRDGAVELITSDGIRLRSAPIALGYFDPISGKSQIIAQLQDTAPVQTAPNQITFPDALDKLHASVTYKYRRDGISQNLILHEAPPPPPNGFSELTRLEFYTAFSPETPEPVRTPHPIRQEMDPTVRANSAEPDFEDEDLAFGIDTIFIQGRAFALDGDSSAVDSVPVGKRFLQLNGVPVLVEAVEMKTLAPLLKDLKQAAAFQIDRKGTDLALLDGQLTRPLARVLPSRRTSPPDQTIQIAHRSTSLKGVVLDYDTKSSSVSSFTFQTGMTYYIPSSFGVGTGSTVFQAGSTIKFATDAYLWLYGTISCPASGAKVILTSKDDNLFGESIGTGTPTYAASSAILSWYPTSGTTLDYMRIRWAKQGVTYNAHSSPPSHVINGVSFEHCQTAVVVGYPAIVSLGVSAKQCDVVTPTSGTVSGSLAVDCGVVNASMQAATDQAEPAIAVNPLNSSQIRIVAMHPQATPNPQMELMSSNDGGATWTTIFLPSGTMPQCAGDSDPALVWDDFGNLIMAYRTSTGLALYYSTDGGATIWTAVPGFSMTGVVQMPQLATATYGSTHSLWVSVQRDSTVGVVATGTLVNSLGSFSSSWTLQTSGGVSVIPNASFGQFTSLAIGPAGEVVVAFIERTQLSPGVFQQKMRIALDNDGLGSGLFVEKQVFNVTFGWQELVPPSTPDQVAPIPTVGWYRTAGSDKLYLVYTDKGSSATSDTDIFVRTSSDKFTNISGPIKINNTLNQVNTTASQWLPRLAVDQTSGNVAVYWYDCREDTLNTQAQLYMAVSRDVFATAPNFRMTPTASSPAYGYRDYIGLTYKNGFIYPAWTGNTPSQSKMEIFTAKIAY